jgi:hypothetical protein
LISPEASVFIFTIETAMNMLFGVSNKRKFIEE